MKYRKIIHIDMDAFYASIEIREQPSLSGKPVVVAFDGPRSVICAASYEARKHGLRSAMALSTAKKLYPKLICVSPNFELYRHVSMQIHKIFKTYTDLIEPLSFDEAYLDVTENLKNIPYAIDVAKNIRNEIFNQTELTASAGIAPNKFLAKIASDWNKPNGQFVLPPHKVTTFLEKLPLEKIPGIGKVTLKKLHQLNAYLAGDLLNFDRNELLHHFGKYGYRLYDLARGDDKNPVKANRERLQISSETTLLKDLTISEIKKFLPKIINDLWNQLINKTLEARGVTLKLKTSEFKTITRSLTYSSTFQSKSSILDASEALFNKIPQQYHSNLFRLVGISINHLHPKNFQHRLWD